MQEGGILPGGKKGILGSFGVTEVEGIGCDTRVFRGIVVLSCTASVCQRTFASCLLLSVPCSSVMLQKKCIKQSVFGLD